MKLEWKTCYCGCSLQYPTNLGVFNAGLMFDAEDALLLDRAFAALAEKESAWLEWTGGNRPPELGSPCKITVKLRGGVELTATESRQIRWTHNGSDDPSDVIAYKENH